MILMLSPNLRSVGSIAAILARPLGCLPLNARFLDYCSRLFCAFMMSLGIPLVLHKDKKNVIAVPRTTSLTFRKSGSLSAGMKFNHSSFLFYSIMTFELHFSFMLMGISN